VRVRTSRGDAVVKRYKASVSLRSVVLEHSVLGELERMRFPAPRLWRTSTGRTSVELDGLQHAVFGYLAGYRDPRDFVMAAPDRRRVDLMAAAALADLHLALAEHAPPPSDSLGFTSRGGDRVRSMAWYAEQLASIAAPRRVRVWLESSLGRVRETLERDQLPLTVVHGDFGWHNLLLKPGARLVIVDFELARLDWRVVDLAIVLPRLAAGGIGFDLDRVRHFLAAYRQRSEATQVELRRIPDVLAYLSMDRAVVAWGRERDGIPGDWGAEARQRVMLAEELLRGEHPLSAIAAG
jgi:Ser/Thr protein kinase RdoA (MazF antagonist)